MAAYFCRHGKQAPSMDSARYCKGDEDHLIFATSGLVPPPARVPAPRHTSPCPEPYRHGASRKRFVIKIDPDGPPTANQLWKVEKENGDLAYAKTLTKQGCSDYIDSLLYPEDYPEPGVAIRQVASTVATPQASEPGLVPLDLLAGVPDGRFAVRPDESVPWTFLRVTRPKRGQFDGYLKVQTQHSDSYALAVTFDVNGKVRWYQTQRTVEPWLLLLIADYKWAAVNYTRELKKCCRCGRKLTAEESRKYGIGPECITHWPWVPEEIESRSA